MNISFRPFAEGDKDTIESLLSSYGLPLDGLFADNSEYYVARNGNTFVGCAGFEYYSPDALLRSVAVIQHYGNRGIGSLLTDFMINRAREKNIHRIVLLTNTAAKFFAAKGFTIIQKSECNNPALQASVEFSHACPLSAVCEVLNINP